MSESHRPPAAPIYSMLGRLIGQARSERGVTQEVLAVQVGLTRSSITNIEAGRQRIQLHVFLEIAAALDVPPEQLLPRLSHSRPEDFMADLDGHLEGQPDSTYDFVRKALRMLPAGEWQ